MVDGVLAKKCGILYFLAALNTILIIWRLHRNIFVFYSSLTSKYEQFSRERCKVCICSMFISTFVEFSKLTMQKKLFSFICNRSFAMPLINQSVCQQQKKQKKQHTKNKKVLYNVDLGLVDA